MNTKKEIIRRAAAFVSALTFLSACNINAFSAVAEDTVQSETPPVTDVSEIDCTLQLRVSDTFIKADRQQEILNRFINSDTAAQLPHSPSLSVSSNNDNITLDAVFKCPPDDFESYKNDILLKIAEYKTEYLIGEELYTVSFNSSSAKFNVDEYFRIDDHTNCLDDSSGNKYRGFKEHEGSYYVKKDSEITLQHFKLRRGYYSHYPDENEIYLVDRKLIVENFNNNRTAKVGFYDGDTFHSLVDIDRTVLNIVFDTNDVWVNQPDTEKNGFNQEQVLTIPWLDIDDTNINVHSRIGSDVKKFVVRNMYGDGNNAYFDVDPSDSNGTPINIRSLIAPQLSEAGKSEFTKNAEYHVSITGLHNINTAQRELSGKGTDIIAFELKENEVFNIPYIIQNGKKTWYLSQYRYKYENLPEVESDELNFNELCNEELKNGNTGMELPYKQWSDEDNQDHKLKSAEDGTLFYVKYSPAAGEDDEVRNKVMKQFITSVNESGLHSGKRNNNTADIEYSPEYTLSLPEEYKGRTFIYMDEKERIYTQTVETVESDGKEQYILKLNTLPEDEGIKYRPLFYKIMIMADENGPCDMTPFIIYFDSDNPELTYKNENYRDSNNWSNVDKYSFEIHPDDPIEEIGDLPLQVADAKEFINDNKTLGSISAVSIGDVVIEKPENGWGALGVYEGTKEPSEDGTGGYKVTLYRKSEPNGKLYFNVEVSLLGTDNGFDSMLPVVLYDNSGRKSDQQKVAVKIDTGKPKVSSIKADELIGNIIKNNKLSISAEITDKYGNSACSGVSGIVYRFEQSTDRNSFTNEYIREYTGTEADLKTKTADFDFDNKNLKGYIIVELTDTAGNTDIYYYSNDNGCFTQDPEKAVQLIIDNSAPPLPFISEEENNNADAVIDGKYWFRDYHAVHFSVNDETDLNSGISSVGFVICGKERVLDISQLGFGTSDEDISAAAESLANGGFYLDFIADAADNTKFVPHLKNTDNKHIDIALFDLPLSLSEDGKLDIGIYCTDNAGNRCIRPDTNENIRTTEYYIDNNAPNIGKTFYRSASENENSIRMRSYGTFTNRKISVEVPVADKSGAPSSGLSWAKLKYTYGKGYIYEAETQIFNDGKAVFDIPADEITAPTIMSGTLSISAADAVGNITEDIALSSPENNDKLIVENIPPQISDEPEIKSGIPYIVNEGKTDEQQWYSDDTEITFSAGDEDSGLANVTITPVNGKFTSEKPLENDYTDKTSETLTDKFTLKTSPEIDGEFKVAVSAEDNAGNVSSKEYRVFKDVSAPYISGFRFDRAVSNYDNDMVDPEKMDRYSHFADDDIDMTVRINDTLGSTSGIKSVIIEFRNVDGTTVQKGFTKDQLTLIEEGIYELNCKINEGFKGDITAWAYDNVGNVSEKRSPNGFISENYDTHDSHVEIKADLPKTDKRDEDGLELYKENVKAKLEVADNFSGIQQISWMTSDMDDWQTVDIDIDGNIIGESYGWSINSKNRDRNLSVKASCEIEVSKDANNDFIMLKVKDNTGHITSYEKYFSIDKKAPVIDVTGIEKNEGVVYYNSHKTAHITISERNYEVPNINGIADNSFTTDKNTPANTDQRKYTKDIAFNSDGRYELSISAADLAGNNAEDYNSGTFVIDTTSPKASISVKKLNGDEVKTSDRPYIESDASASVTVDEVNFSPDSVTITINGTVYTPGNWTAGDSHTANIPASYFSDDGEYTISVSGRDLAGNHMRSVSASFTVDKKEPEIKISGISNANKGEVAPVINITDDNLNAQDVKVYKNGELLDVTYEEDGEVAKYDVNSKGDYIVGRWISDNANAGSKKKMAFDNFPKEESYDGNYKIEVDTKDKAENSKSDSLEFSVNRFGSVFTVEDADKINGKYLSKPPTIVITERNVDKHSSDNDVVIIIDKGSNTVKLTRNLYTISEPIELEDGSGYEYTYTIKPENFSQDLNYNISIQSIDEAGNKNVSSGRGAEISFNVDTHDPDFKCDDLADRAEFKVSSRMFKLNVNEKLTHIKVSTSQNEVLLETDGDNEDNSYSFSMPSSNATRDLTIELTDLAGNKTTKTYKDLLITENVALFVMHKAWAKIAGIAAAAVTGVLAGAYIIRKRWRGY